MQGVILLFSAVYTFLCCFFALSSISLNSVGRLFGMPEDTCELVVKKQFKENTVRIILENNSSEKISDCIVVDRIPFMGKVSVSAPGVCVSSELLTWNIEELAAGSNAVLVYSVKSVRHTGLENVSFLSKKPLLVRVPSA